MDIEIRINVTADLCYDTLRNAAYYKSGWNAPRDLKKSDLDFWVNLNGNLLDIAVLSWCFLFGDEKAEFRWQKLIEDEKGFSSKMYQNLNCTEQVFQDYIDIMRTYRDKRVAHRDRYLSSSPKIQYPDLDLAINSTCFLFSELHQTYPVMKELVAHGDLKTFYKERLDHGMSQYRV